MLLFLDRAKATIRYDIGVKSIRKSAPGELWKKIKTTHSKLQLTLCDLTASNRFLFPYIIVITIFNCRLRYARTISVHGLFGF